MDKNTIWDHTGYAVFTLNIPPGRHEQVVSTKIKPFRKEQSDQGLYNLPISQLIRLWNGGGGGGQKISR